MTELLRVEGLVKHFPVRRGLAQRRAVVHAVDGVDLTVQRGEVVSLVGESGSGKTTFGRCVTGLTRPTSGSIHFDGVDLSRPGRSVMAKVRRRIQPVFQDPRSSLDPRWTIARTIREPLDAYAEGSTAARDAHVRELMSRVGLAERLAERRPHELSGGQQQRVAIAAALALSPDLIVADEPVSALDVSVQAQILNLLVELRRSMGLTLLFIAHDLAVVEHISDRVAVMYLGKVVEFGTVREVFDHPKHPYTKALIAAIPRPDPEQRATAGRLTGEIPSPVSPPSGCRFHPRCPVAIERCRVEMPPPTLFRAGHVASCHVAAEEHLNLT